MLYMVFFLLPAPAADIQSSLHALQHSDSGYRPSRVRAVKGLGKALKAAAEDGTLKRHHTDFDRTIELDSEIGGSSAGAGAGAGAGDARKKQKPPSHAHTSRGAENGADGATSWSDTGPSHPSWSTALTDVDAFDVFGDEDEEEDDEGEENEEEDEGEGGMCAHGVFTNYTEI
jgi:hypothetical protein